MVSATTSPLPIPAPILQGERVSAGSPERYGASTQPKWTWSCRVLPGDSTFAVDHRDRGAPRVGDVVAVMVTDVGNHTRITGAGDKRMRIFAGDVVIGVFGNRYATDAFEAEIGDLENLSLVTNSGMISTVVTQHAAVLEPTMVQFIGYLCDADGRRLNLKSKAFRPAKRPAGPPPIIPVVGTGMNSGKTTVTARLTRSLVERGLRVAACKLTGSVSNRDYDELHATGAADTRDFSDYGFPSTYLCERPELLQLFDTMVADACDVDPDVIVMEIADGVLQRETSMLLESRAFIDATAGVLLSARCATSALYAINRIGRTGAGVLAVSGMITNSPLFVRECRGLTPAPIVSVRETGDELADLIVQRLRHLQLNGRDGD